MSEADATVLEGGSARFCPTCRSEFSSGSRCPFDGAPLTASAAEVDPFIGRMLDGRYRIDKRVGEGASAVVFLGRDMRRERDVAIKILRPLGGDEHVARFRREAQIVSRLASPNNVEVYDFGQHGETPYIAMEYLEGSSLEEVLRSGSMPPQRTALILRDVCYALEEAHALGMIHRDLKPANIFLARKKGREVVKVLDFGIAKVTTEQGAVGIFFAQKLTAMGAVMGTPIYMSPEQAKNEELDARSDLYSLGVVAYHCLAGRPPFEGAPGKVIFEHTNKLPPPLDPKIDPSVSSLVMRMLAKERSERPESATALRTDLDRILSGEGVNRRSAAPRLWLVGLGAVLAVLALLGAWLLVSGPPTGDDEPRPRGPVPAGFYDIPLDD